MRFWIWQNSKIDDEATKVEAVAVIGSLIYLACEVRDSAKATRGATSQAIIDAISNIEARITDVDFKGFFG